ncbi:MAG: glutamine--tRNA ligase, partial [Candidatus Thermoplasmatota archaeon]|nr:glutamine--tRNA ligase [Candidatus Thermoplasmatota archaeon]
WVSAEHSLEAEIRLYDKLFTVEDPAGQKEKSYKELLNPDSLSILKGCKVEPAVKELNKYDRFQFERQGYFCVDPDTSSEKLVFNRTVGLRDTWARIQKQVKK